MTGTWTDEDMAKVAAEELGTALRKLNLGYADCTDDDDRVALDFHDLSEAAVLLTILFRNPAGPGTLYDRATSSCVTINNLSDRYGDDVPRTALQHAFGEAWIWQVHPAMTESRVVQWHAGVTMSGDDAMAVAAALNSGAAL